MPLARLLQRLLRREPDSPAARGEKIAEKYLRSLRYKRLARNLRLRHGEIDLLMLTPDRQTLVFVEVKTALPDRSSQVPPELRVGKHKQQKIAQLAATLVRKRGLVGRPIRFDIVGVDLHHDREADVRHYPAAFESPW